MNNFTSETKYILNDIDLKKGDTVMLVSDISSLLISFKKKGKVFDANLSLLDSIAVKMTPQVRDSKYGQEFVNYLEKRRIQGN